MTLTKQSNEDSPDEMPSILLFFPSNFFFPVLFLNLKLQDEIF